MVCLRFCASTTWAWTMWKPGAFGVKVQAPGTCSTFTVQVATGSSTGSLSVSQRSPAVFFRTNFQSRRSTETWTSARCRFPSGETATASSDTGLPTSAKPSTLRWRTPA